MQPRTEPVRPSPRTARRSREGAGTSRSISTSNMSTAIIYNPGHRAGRQGQAAQLHAARASCRRGATCRRRSHPSRRHGPGQPPQQAAADVDSYDPGCTGGNHDEPNVPHCFNGTNLHTHGLWVNPSGNGDNVLLSINPGVKFEYEYAIPREHPAGTFWYHTHRHGSTALQVSSGMAGRADHPRQPAADRDATRRSRHAARRRRQSDRTLVFQQIQYGCLDASRTSRSGPRQSKHDGHRYGLRPGRRRRQSRPMTTRRASASDRAGAIGPLHEHQRPHPADLPGAAGRGRALAADPRRRPRHDRAAASARRKPNATLAARAEAGRGAAWSALIEQNCEGEPLPFHLVAADGLTMAAGAASDVGDLAAGLSLRRAGRLPGGGQLLRDRRAEPGDRAASAALPSGSRLLGDGAGRADATARSATRRRSTAQLIAAAERRCRPTSATRWSPTCATACRLSRFVAASRRSRTSELTGRPGAHLRHHAPAQERCSRSRTSCRGSRATIREPYDPARLDRQADARDGRGMEADLATGAGHPFHIHVNPFEIVEILNDKNPATTSARPAPTTAAIRNIRASRACGRTLCG